MEHFKSSEIFLSFMLIIISFFLLYDISFIKIFLKILAMRRVVTLFRLKNNKPILFL